MYSNAPVNRLKSGVMVPFRYRIRALTLGNYARFAGLRTEPQRTPDWLAEREGFEPSIHL